MHYNRTYAEFSLKKLLHPNTSEMFFREYWETKALVINRQQIDYFEPLLSLNDIDYLITTLNLHYPQVSLVNADQAVTKDQYTIRGDVIDIAKFYQLFFEGATIICNQLQTRVSSLATLCRTMEQQFCIPFQANIYITPCNSKGFKPHYDDHDVFILQIHNSKHWKIYDTPIILPLRGQEFDSSIHKPSTTIMEFELHAGDLAYIPRGVMHDAQSNNEVSLHITLGALAYTWTNVFMEALSEVCLADPAFRKALPVGFAHADFDRSKAVEIFRELLNQFSKKANFDNALNCFIEEFASTSRPQLEGQMSQIRNLHSLGLDSIASVRPGLIYSLHEEGEILRIRCYRKEISLPFHTSDAIRFALSNSMFHIYDLPGKLDNAGKLVLARRLVIEGLIMLM